MKTSIITLVLVLLSITAIAGNKGNRASEILYIDGKTLSNDRVEGKVLISVYADGELETQFFSGKRGNFDYYLDANTYYSITFEKEGFAKKTVEVNTYTQKLNFEFYEFGFDMEMETEEELGVKEAVAAQVSFNKKRRKFMYARPIRF